MLLAAPTEKDQLEWMYAFREHQIDVFAARSKLFDKKLQKAGVRVPRGSILLTKGMNTPL